MSLFPVFAPVTDVVPVTLAFTDNSILTPNTNPYTFSSQAIGTAATNRSIIVAAGTSRTTDTAGTVASLTVGGQSGVKVVDLSRKATGIRYANISMWKAEVTSGTTATIVVTWDGTCSGMGIGVWAIYGAATAATDTDTSIAEPGSTNVTIPAGGVAIGASCSYTDSGAHTWAWTNLTENYDETIESDIKNHSGASDGEPSTGSLTVTTTYSVSVDSATAVLATFGPA